MDDPDYSTWVDRIRPSVKKGHGTTSFVSVVKYTTLRTLRRFVTEYSYRRPDSLPPTSVDRIYLNDRESGSQPESV